jgi:hypothetical protein
MNVKIVDPTTGEPVDLNNQALAKEAFEHTPADADLPAGVKAVVFDANGTMSYKNATGSAITGYPVSAGVPLPFIPTRITAMTGPTKCFIHTGNR